MAKANLYNGSGEAKGTVDLPAELFEQPIHKQALYEAVRNYLANQRQGTHDTKTRAQVKCSTAKLFRQKGTGRARAGAGSSPSRVGGGVAFGPHPRDYSYKLPQKIRRLALKSALSDRAGHDRVRVLEDLEMESPKTQALPPVRVNVMNNRRIDARPRALQEESSPASPCIDNPNLAIRNECRHRFRVEGHVQFPRHHVGRAQGEHRNRLVGTRQAVHDLVQGTVASYADEAVKRGIARRTLRVACTFGNKQIRHNAEPLKGRGQGFSL